MILVYTIELFLELKHRLSKGKHYFEVDVTTLGTTMGVGFCWK